MPRGQRHRRVSPSNPPSDQPKGQRGRRGQGSVGDTEPAVSYRCPDCDSDAELSRDDLGIWHLTIRHDDTCPAYKEMTL